MHQFASIDIEFLLSLYCPITKHCKILLQRWKSENWYGNLANCTLNVFVISWEAQSICEECNSEKNTLLAAKKPWEVHCMEDLTFRENKFFSSFVCDWRNYSFPVWTSALRYLRCRERGICQPGNVSGGANSACAIQKVLTPQSGWLHPDKPLSGLTGLWAAVLTPWCRCTSCFVVCIPLEVHFEKYFHY